MTRYTAFKAGLAGIAIFLNIIVVVSKDVPSTGSATLYTTANSSHGAGDEHVTTSNQTVPIVATETSPATIDRTLPVQLSKTEQELEELLLTTQNHSATEEDEGSGDEPFPITTSKELTLNLSIPLLLDDTTSQEVSEVSESKQTTPSVATTAFAITEARHDETTMIHNASTHDIPMSEVVTTKLLTPTVVSAPTTVVMVIPENVTETTNVAFGNVTLGTKEVAVSTTTSSETTMTSVPTTIVSLSINESSTLNLSDVTEHVISTSLSTTTKPTLVNGSPRGRSMGNTTVIEQSLDIYITKDALTTDSPIPSVSHAPSVTSKEETDEYTTYASSIVEHHVTTEGKPHTTMPEPITLTQQSSTQPPLTIETKDVYLTTETTITEYSVSQITNKTESTPDLHTMPVTTPDTEPTTRMTDKSTGTLSPIETTKGSTELNATRYEFSTAAPTTATNYQTTLSTEVFNELTTLPQSKCYDELSEPEFFNSVSAVFLRPIRMKGMLFDKETFKETVICLINTYELQGWPLTALNMSDCDEFDKTLEPRLLTVTDLVIIQPSPTLNNNEITVSFFTRNTTSKYSGQIVSRNRTLSVLNNQKEYLMNQMGMNITDIYGGMKLSQLVAPIKESFYMRHSLLLIILAVVSGVCILIIISGLIYIKCRTTKSKWSSTSSYLQEKSKLQRDILCSEMGQHLNSDDDINKDETMRTINGNGFFSADTGSGSSVTPIGDEDGWVIPYDELSPEEKSAVDVEDTKL